MTQPSENLQTLADSIKNWGKALGFSAVGIADTDLANAERHYQAWIEKGFHGDMDYMAKHRNKRTQPAELVAGTLRIISVRMDYQPPNAKDAEEVLRKETE